MDADFRSSARAAARDEARERAAVSGAIPPVVLLLLVLAFTILYAVRQPFEWSWFARVPGMALGGLLLFVVKPPAAEWIVPVIGWAVPFAWWRVVRHTRVGDWPWKEHLLASSLWFGSNATACGLWFLNGLAP